MMAARALLALGSRRRMRGQRVILDVVLITIYVICIIVYHGLARPRAASGKTPGHRDMGHPVGELGVQCVQPSIALEPTGLMSARTSRRTNRRVRSRDNQVHRAVRGPSPD